jgi:hypothetical protein
VLRALCLHARRLRPQLSLFFALVSLQTMDEAGMTALNKTVADLVRVRCASCGGAWDSRKGGEC